MISNKEYAIIELLCNSKGCNFGNEDLSLEPIILGIVIFFSETINSLGMTLTNNFLLFKYSYFIVADNIECLKQLLLNVNYFNDFKKSTVNLNISVSEKLSCDAIFEK